MASAPVPRRSLFAVWRWSKWAWALTASVLIVLHFLLTVPVLFVLCLIDHLDWADLLLSTVFYPTGLLANNCDWFAGMLNWQWAALERVFGHPKSGFIFGPLDSILCE